MPLNALWLLADAETLALSLVQDQVVSEVIDDVIGAGAKLLQVEILNTLVLRELGASVLTVADLAHDEHVRALTLNVVKELGARHMLVLLTVANVATKLGTMELSVRLQLTERRPDDLRFTTGTHASVRELAEIDTVLQHLVHFLQEVTAGLAVGAADIVLGRRLATGAVLRGGIVSMRAN